VSSGPIGTASGNMIIMSGSIPIGKIVSGDTTYTVNAGTYTIDLFGNYVSAQAGEFKIAQIARF